MNITWNLYIKDKNEEIKVMAENNEIRSNLMFSINSYEG